MKRRKTSNTQHPISNNQWFPMPLIGGWVLDVGCWMFPRVHGEDRGEGRAKTNAPPLPSPLLHPMEERESIRLRLRRAASIASLRLKYGQERLPAKEGVSRFKRFNAYFFPWSLITRSIASASGAWSSAWRNSALCNSLAMLASVCRCF